LLPPNFPPISANLLLTTLLKMMKRSTPNCLLWVYYFSHAGTVQLSIRFALIVSRVPSPRSLCSDWWLVPSRWWGKGLFIRTTRFHVSRLSTSIAYDFGLSALGLVMSLESTIVTYHIALGIGPPLFGLGFGFPGRGLGLKFRLGIGFRSGKRFGSVRAFFLHSSWTDL
jgi:hypothetical protein